MNVNMAGSDENNPGLIGPLKNTHGGLAGANGMFVSGNGQNRRALSNINWNIIRDPDATKKPGLTDFRKQRACNKNLLPPNPVHRPITRKFAAEMAKQSSDEELMNHGKLIQNPTHTKDVNIIDVEDSAEDDFPVPMYVQQTEAMLEEIDRMEEVEMEDMELVVDIDSNDKKDPLSVVEYIDELYTYYKKSEGSNCVAPNYMTQQSDINERMRGILIDWLIEVHYKFELMDETLYLTVNLIDRFLAIKPVVRKKLQLVGVTAMLLACKYEEVSVPIVEDFILISDKAYMRKEVLEMEKLMVNALQFNFSVPTPYVFMRRFLKAAQSDKKLELVSFFLIELCLVEYEMLKFPPSLLAAGAIFTAQCTIGGFKQWSKTSEWYSGYSEEQLLDCSRLMVTFHQKAGSGKLTGVHRKYSTSKFGYAARIRPASFLLDTRFFI